MGEGYLIGCMAAVKIKKWISRFRWRAFVAFFGGLFMVEEVSVHERAVGIKEIEVIV